MTSSWDPPTGPIPVQRGGRGVVWPVVLIAVAVVLAAAAFWVRSAADDRTAEADRLTQAATRAEADAKQLTEDAGNEALSDVDLTREVTGYLTTAIETTFSYDYTNLAKTEQAAQAHLTDKARCEYDQLFGEVEQYATEQKIVLTTTVRELALAHLTGDDAEALVYIDQLSTRADVNKTVAVGGQFAVTAHRTGDQWKITEFDMFGQPLFNGEPAPTC